MKLFQNNNTSSQKLPDTSRLTNPEVDRKKLRLLDEELIRGVECYTLFQKYPFFSWPAWLRVSVDVKSKFFSQIAPPFLTNNSFRKWISFNNFLSKDEIHIDPTGMISPSYSGWSVEVWILSGNEISRPQDNIESVNCVRNTDFATVNVNWSSDNAQLEQIFYGARSSVDEALCSLTIKNNARKKDISCLIVVRPYNHLGIGGLNNIEYSHETGLVTTNGGSHIGVDSKPDFFLAGNGNEGDIIPKIVSDPPSSVCENGMASLALGYDLQKGENSLNIRISLNKSERLEPGIFSFDVLKEEYLDYSKKMITKGVNISMPNKKIVNSFYASKLSILSMRIGNSNNLFNIPASRSLYLSVSACCRMGYYSEALRLLDFPIEVSKQDKKNLNLTLCVSAGYILLSYADYFIHTRNLQFLQACYISLKDLIESILNYLGQNSISENSLQYYSSVTPKEHDKIIFSAAFRLFSYLARCMGIFGDEKLYLGEAEKLDLEFSEYLDSAYVDINTKDQFFYTDLYTGFPFGLSSFNEERVRRILDEIISVYGSFPVYIESLGFDTMATLVCAHNLLLLKDPMVFDILNWIFDSEGQGHSLPEYINPVSGVGCSGNADSRENSAMLFMLLRNLFFIDWPERLEILPIPDEKWFKPGKELIISKAPSRFGEINLRISSTENEVHFYFEELPKYVPPDILINLPFKAKLDSGDDYILKKHEANSWIINGWPSDLRFLKK